MTRHNTENSHQEFVGTSTLGINGEYHHGDLAPYLPRSLSSIMSHYRHEIVAILSPTYLPLAGAMIA
jgi:hypothetical protein